MKVGDRVLAAYQQKKKGTVKIARPTKVYKSKWESEYAKHLDLLCRSNPDILDWKYEAIKLRLADGCWYTPDFVVVTLQGVEFHEVKGYYREAARVRFRVAADTFPYFKFKIIRLKNGQWVEE